MKTILAAFTMTLAIGLAQVAHADSSEVDSSLTDQTRGACHFTNSDGHADCTDDVTQDDCSVEPLGVFFRMLNAEMLNAETPNCLIAKHRKMRGVVRY
jgi:hypothetical protein